MRVHRSYIVNLRCIKGYVRGRVFLSDCLLYTSSAKLVIIFFIAKKSCKKIPIFCNKSFSRYRRATSGLLHLQFVAVPLSDVYKRQVSDGL